MRKFSLCFPDASEVEEEETEQKKKPAEKTKTKPEKRKIVTEKPAKAKKKKNNEQVVMSFLYKGCLFDVFTVFTVCKKMYHINRAKD